MMTLRGTMLSAQTLLPLETRQVISAAAQENRLETVAVLKRRGNC